MAAYADLTYYKDVFLGVAIADADFPRLVLRASEYLDYLTADRYGTVVDPAIQDKFSMAACAMAEDLLDIEVNSAAVGIISESVGNTSVTYSEGSVSTLTTEKRLQFIARRYLANTFLMYRGVYPAPFRWTTL